jgi:hypothetical protein
MDVDDKCQINKQILNEDVKCLINKEILNEDVKCLINTETGDWLPRRR